MCRTSRAKRELLRVVRMPDGRVIVDPTGRTAGRGAYVCADGTCRATAFDHGALARALHGAVPAELATELAGAPGTTIPTGGRRGTK